MHDIMYDNMIYKIYIIYITYKMTYLKYIKDDLKNMRHFIIQNI